MSKRNGIPKPKQKKLKIQDHKGPKLKKGQTRAPKKAVQKHDRAMAKMERTDAYTRRKHVIYSLICDEMYVPMKAKELAVILQVKPEQKDLFHQVLDDLVAEGKIEITKKGRYLKTEIKSIEGTFISNPKGFGFVRVEGSAEDYFIPKEYTLHAFQDDLVEIQPVKSSKDGRHRTEARVVRVVSHGITQLVGTYQKNGNYGFVIPDHTKMDQDIFIPSGKDLHAVNGHKVVVKINEYGDKGRNPEGEVIEILGHVNDPGVDIMSIVKSYEIPVEFPPEVLAQASAEADDVTEADCKGRKDLRQVQMVTIDGDDAKDLDDAISIARDGEGYVLGVHIADVSHYVDEKSPLDEEALKRGTSVYLVDRVIPMLPHVLSNGICSLNQGEDRLALSCLMHLDAKGKIVDHEIAATVVNIDQRMSYHNVQLVLDGDEEACQTYADYVEMFHLMKEVADKRRARRHKRGAIDFDLPETDIILDEDGRPVDLHPHEINDATKIIEDFMLAANETVAKEFYDREIPFLYRTHEQPDGDKIRSLQTYVGALGYVIKGDPKDIEPKQLQELIAQIQGKPEEALVSKLTLRSMQQARYTVESTGHFGLAAKYYCHFASPIRRYPDLQIHRIIHEVLEGKFSKHRSHHFESVLPVVAVQTSKLERRADEIEREVDKLKKAQFMSEHLHEVFDGTISGVTSWGFYVELPNTVEGLVPMVSLDDDYYDFSEDTYELIGRRKNKHYKLGQSVTVECVAVDTMARNIDFKLVSEDND